MASQGVFPFEIISVTGHDLTGTSAMWEYFLFTQEGTIAGTKTLAGWEAGVRQRPSGGWSSQVCPKTMSIEAIKTDGNENLLDNLMNAFFMISLPSLQVGGHHRPVVEAAFAAWLMYLAAFQRDCTESHFLVRKFQTICAHDYHMTLAAAVKWGEAIALDFSAKNTPEETDSSAFEDMTKGFALIRKGRRDINYAVHDHVS